MLPVSILPEAPCQVQPGSAWPIASAPREFRDRVMRRQSRAPRQLFAKCLLRKANGIRAFAARRRRRVSLRLLLTCRTAGADESELMAERLDNPLRGIPAMVTPTRALEAPLTQRPLCFVLMPFGQKPATGGGTIDFDAVYQELISPAISEAGLEPLRADEEMTGGVIHKPMFERLILCEFAVADLTTANANVFYELGVRHAVRPSSTILLFAAGGAQLPFDVAPLRAIPYQLSPAGGPADLSARSAIASRLTEARNLAADSPIFQLVDGFPDIQRLKTDVFRDRVQYREEIKARLTSARQSGADAVRDVARS